MLSYRSRVPCRLAGGCPAGIVVDPELALDGKRVTGWREKR